MDIDIRAIEKGKGKPLPQDESNLGFGRIFSDHMFLMEYAPGRCWHNARIEPFHSLSLSPAATVLHYAQEVFEGLKAYRGKDNGIYLFRYKDNFRRMNHSCARVVMPQIDVEAVSDALKKLILLDQRWIPSSPGCALYIRPTMFGVDPMLGVRPSDTYLFTIIIGPVGAYYPEGFNPISIAVSDRYVRAVHRGVGEAKTGANYVASLLAQKEARDKGYSQVLWLDAKELKYVEEVGTMNIFFRFGEEVVTSPLTGSILPGITRDSVIKILKLWGMKVTERLFTIEEVLLAQRDGSLQEVFGTGTAAIISPVSLIAYKGSEYRIGDGKTGSLSQRLYDNLIQIQLGHEADPLGWVERIDR